MDNTALLMLVGASKKPGGIGKAGGQGFGVGVYPGDPSDLTAMGLFPMQGCEDPAHENYGNYQHTNGSVMVFVPAFCYRIGNAAAPSYSRDKENALEIRDAALGEGGGWILHRAFIDGGVQKLGFFIDKYKCSKDSTERIAISQKNRLSIELSDYNIYTDEHLSMSMPGCSGRRLDAIVLGRARGDHYSCATAFQWSAISMLSLAHGQASTSAQFCGWYDADYVKNYPKGCNRSSKDFDDPSVTWEGYNIRRTGSGTPFNKTTHNGQLCGITDVNGLSWEVVIGFKYPVNNNIVYLIKETVRANDITVGNRSDTSLFDTIELPYTANTRQVHWGGSAFFTDSDGIGRAMCGIYPKTLQTNDKDIFGKDYGYLSGYSDATLVVSGGDSSRSSAGIWYRDSSYNWDDDSSITCSFRAAGYAK